LERRSFGSFFGAEENMSSKERRSFMVKDLEKRFKEADSKGIILAKSYPVRRGAWSRNGS